MSNPFFIKCLKDTEGWWTEGEIYEARRVAGGFVQFGDDNQPKGEDWSASPIQYRGMVRSCIRSVVWMVKSFLRRQDNELCYQTSGHPLSRR